MTICPDMPQKVLDVFNRVDYKKLSALKRGSLIMMLKSFITLSLKSNIKQSNKTYQSSGKKKVANDIDQDLIKMLNMIDYASIPSDQMATMLNFLNNFIDNNLPVKNAN